MQDEPPRNRQAFVCPKQSIAECEISFERGVFTAKGDGHFVPNSCFGHIKVCKAYPSCPGGKIDFLIVEKIFLVEQADFFKDLAANKHGAADRKIAWGDSIVLSLVDLAIAALIEMLPIWQPSSASRP